MCAKCDAKMASIYDELVGQPVVVLASEDESCVFTYGTGIFKGMVVKSEPTYEFIETCERTYHALNNVEGRVMMRMGWVQEGSTGEEIAKLDAALDAELAGGLDTFIEAVWRRHEQVPQIDMPDGTSIFGQRIVPEHAFEQGVKDRLVMQVPYIETENDE